MLNRFLVFAYNLSFKKIVALSFIFAIALSVPLVYSLLKNETGIFSEAARTRETVEILDESKVPYPTEPPQITYVTRFYARSGDSIVIFGKNFGKAQKESKVYIGDKELGKDSVSYWNVDEIEITLPAVVGLTRVGVNINGSSAFWNFKLNAYDELTQDSLSINNAQNYIRASSVENLKVYYAKDEPTVYGAKNAEFVKLNIPEDFLEDNIVNVEMFKDNKQVNFKVQEIRN